jgi:F-type H+-transporting ATPase subunit gamma
MAKARALDKRRKSVRNIRKITRTMELIATAQFKKAMDRASALSAYTDRITALVKDLAKSGMEVSHPLLKQPEETNRASLLVLSGNRGLCAGYNGNIFRLASARWTQWQNDIPEPKLEVSGKRGIGAFRFRGIQPDETFTHFEDKPTYEEVDVLATAYLEAFTTGKLDRLDVAYTKFHSLGKQTAVIETLLPLSGLGETSAETDEPSGESQYEFFPSAESILDEIVPTSFRMKLFKCFLDAAVSEQIARMMAMKAATENADSMISSLTMSYNRARQGQITGELLEIIGGADALEN